VVVRDADRDADRVCDHARRAGYDAATVVRAYAPDRPATGVCATLFREDDALRAQLERFDVQVAAPQSAGTI
jgi:hypothetical protein